ncbi:MAG TPA: DsbA family oxidoreductase [Steroidobacteraceae bacterium]|jgi:predicted DsbA family dithiol-disulfide isomerase|nr:DsbA family oxidoreductase [Steroidobacteraceae bacterium]
MSAITKLDFVSDVSCPWCAIGLQSLLAALSGLRGVVEAELHFQPFELNPDMGPGGEDIAEHLAHKYGSSPQQFAQSQEMIRARGAQLGFRFDMHKRTRIYNTFDAHRLLHWAGLEGRQLDLKQALFSAYFTDGADPSDHATLARIAAQVGLDPGEAQAILASDRYAAEVRARERFYGSHGINGVPAVILNDRHLIEGGQPAAVFERILRQLAGAEPLPPSAANQ